MTRSWPEGCGCGICCVQPFLSGVEETIGSVLQAIGKMSTTSMRLRARLNRAAPGCRSSNTGIMFRLYDLASRFGTEAHRDHIQWLGKRRALSDKAQMVSVLCLRLATDLTGKAR